MRKAIEQDGAKPSFSEHCSSYSMASASVAGGGYYSCTSMLALAQ